MDKIIEDSRFSHVFRDAKFRRLPKKYAKVKVDKRFQCMFTERKFNIKCSVDKRGRSVNLDSSDDLKKYYDVSENESIEEEKQNRFEETTVESIRKEIPPTRDLKVTSEEKKMLTSQIKKKLKDMGTDYARGEGTIISESSSEEETTDEEDSREMEFEHCWGEIDKDAEVTDEVTSRFAVCNIDWDRIGAKDLMVLFHSFLPQGGVIHSITIYPSEFGLQRMKAEEEKGPTELVENTKGGEEAEESSQVQMEKIRQYQLNRLKYYYAVVVCNSPKTADAIYNECDGLDYECSSSKLDLRFIPEDTTFEQVLAPKESCTALPDLSSYRPKYFVTSALTKAKVDLTWDETDVNRQEMVKSIHNGYIDESSLRNYLACSSSEDEEDEKSDGHHKEIMTDSYQNGIKNSDKNLNDIEKYKALLEDVQSSEKKRKKNSVNMEVTWNLDLEKKANQLIKDTAVEKIVKTPFQQYLDKKKQKKKQRKLEKLSKTTQDKSEDSGNAFSDDEIPSDIDLDDPYFKEELGTSSAGMKNKKKAKKVRKTEEEDEEIKFKKAELELLMYDQELKQKHFNMKDIEKSQVKESKKGKKRRAEAQDTCSDDFNINVNDERFSALYTSSYFNIDPSDPAFRPTKGTKELIAEKLRRRERQEIGMHDQFKKRTYSTNNNSNHQKECTNSDLSILVGNVKKKIARMRR